MCWWFFFHLKEIFCVLVVNHNFFSTSFLVKKVFSLYASGWKAEEPVGHK